MWLRFRKWLAAIVQPIEQKADDAIPDRVKGVRIPHVRYLLALALLVIFVVGYWRGWHKRFVKPDPSLTPVATQGGGIVYQGNQVPAIAKAGRAGKAKPRVTTRPVATTPVEDLPPEEQTKAPAIPPAAGPDNVVRKVELADTQVIPPSRGETYARAYLLPDGSTKIYQDPQREKFWGWQLKRPRARGRVRDSWEAFDRSIDVALSRLRRKIETDPAQPTLIKTIRNAGYMLTVPVERV